MANKLLTQKELRESIKSASKVPGSAAKRPPGGSRKGKPNKTTAALKDMILKALDNAGGIEYLERKANDPRTASAFLTLVGKVLPMTVQGPGPDGEHGLSVRVSFVGNPPA